MLRIATTVVVTFMLTAVGAYVALLASVLVVWEVFGVRDRDGGGIMTVGFLVLPPIALCAAIIAAVVVGRRVARGADANASTGAITRRPYWIAAGAVVGAVACHAIASFVIWLLLPTSFASQAAALAVMWAPTILAGLGAVAGGMLTARVLLPPRR